MEQGLLVLDNVVKHFPLRGGGLFSRSLRVVHAVDGVSFTIGEQETYGLIGESGCGKSTVANLILGLEVPTSGRVLFRGRAIHEMSASDLKAYRRSVQVVFQDPYSSLSPRMRVGHIVAEPLEVSGLYTKKEVQRKVGEALERVGLSGASLFPHELSGGQRQRVAIARALAPGPALLILDEPASALDVSIRAQILNLLRQLRREIGIAYLFISHDLMAVEYMSDRIGVMYAGHLVEETPAVRINKDVTHPYTKMLMDGAMPMHPGSWRKPSIVGEVPNPVEPPPGCRFHPRCFLAGQRCMQNGPPARQAVGPDHWVACLTAVKMTTHTSGA